MDGRIAGRAAAEPARCADCAKSVPLYQTVATRRSRAQLSDFLVAPAQRAAKARDWPRAIPLYQALVVARGPGSPEARQLATLWTLAGQNERAAEAWSELAAAAADPSEHGAAAAEAARLSSTSDPFADKLVLAEQTAEARRGFALGRAAFTARHYGDALVYFHMGYALAPDLPGFLRELGATYDKLGAEREKREFYRRYLVQRPVGGNADAVRAELIKDREGLGTLEISSSLPCTDRRSRQLQGPVLQSQVRDGAVRVRDGRAGQGRDDGVSLGGRRESPRAPVRPHRDREPQVARYHDRPRHHIPGRRGRRPRRRPQAQDDPQG